MKKPHIRDIVAEVLADRQWHGAAELFRATQHLVTPEHAARRYRIEVGPVDNKNMRNAVEWGKWRVVQYYLANYVFRKSIEAMGKGVDRQYRLVADSPRTLPAKTTPTDTVVAEAN